MLEAQRRQELASREAWFAYATFNDAGIKNLNLTALLRVNANDRSRLGWAELRYHGPALMWRCSCSSRMAIRPPSTGCRRIDGQCSCWLASYHLN